MLDLHCHILPDLDDGPKTLGESLDLARFQVADGISHVVATPHCHRFLYLLRDEILPRVESFQLELDARHIPLKVFPGSEIQLTDCAKYRRDYDGDLYCHLGDDARFSLLEFSWQSENYPDDAPDHILWLKKRGTTPILAHPERHGFFANDFGRLRELVEAGAWIQVSVDSLLGRNGEDAKTAGEQFLREFPDAVLASDAHGKNRCSGLSVGFAHVEEHLGADCAAKLRANADLILNHLLTRAF